MFVSAEMMNVSVCCVCVCMRVCVARNNFKSCGQIWITFSVPMRSFHSIHNVVDRGVL